MLQNAYFLAKIGADTAENEQHFAEILPKIGNHPTVRLPRVRCEVQKKRAAVRVGAVRPAAAAADLEVEDARNPVRIRILDINRISNLNFKFPKARIIEKI